MRGLRILGRAGCRKRDSDGVESEFVVLTWRDIAQARS